MFLKQHWMFSNKTKTNWICCKRDILVLYVRTVRKNTRGYTKSYQSLILVWVCRKNTYSQFVNLVNFVIKLIARYNYKGWGNSLKDLKGTSYQFILKLKYCIFSNISFCKQGFIVIWEFWKSSQDQFLVNTLITKLSK